MLPAEKKDGTDSSAGEVKVCESSMSGIGFGMVCSATPLRFSKVTSTFLSVQPLEYVPPMHPIEVLRSDFEREKNSLVQ